MFKVPNDHLGAFKENPGLIEVPEFEVMKQKRKEAYFCILVADKSSPSNVKFKKEGDYRIRMDAAKRANLVTGAKNLTPHAYDMIERKIDYVEKAIEKYQELQEVSTQATLDRLRAEEDYRGALKEDRGKVISTLITARGHLLKFMESYPKSQFEDQEITTLSDEQIKWVKEARALIKDGTFSKLELELELLRQESMVKLTDQQQKERQKEEDSPPQEEEGDYYNPDD